MSWKNQLTCFPCSGKQPRLKGNWREYATRNSIKIEHWRSENPDLAIVTGAVSDIFVVDEDPRHGGDKTLAALEKENGPLPETHTVRTGGGGRHLAFKHPGFHVHNSNDGKALGPGLDLKGDGGYVIAPGSIHPDTGNKYEVLIDREPVEAPEWLLKKIRDHAERKSSGVVTAGSFADGSRNSSLTSVAGLFRRFGFKGEALYQVLAAQNATRCNPPLPDSEVRTIANSVSNYADHPAPDFRATETWAAEQFAEQHKDVARYCTDLNKWFVWDGKRWSPDDLNRTTELIKLFVRSLSFLAASVTEDELRTKVAKFALSCEAANKRHNVESLARGEASIKVLSNFFNRNPWLLNVQNGTIEIDPESKRWTFREHRREDYLSQISPVNYNPEAKCPRWDRFLTEVFPGQPEVVRFLQKSIGYSLSGSIREAVMWLLRGAGRNGKGTIIKTIATMLGDYAIGVKIEMFLVKKNEQGGPRDGRFQLIGKRFVSASEPAEGRKLNAENLKELIDPDGKLSAGKLFSTEDVPFEATQKYWLASNNDLVIRGDDQAMWDRLRRINFTERFANSGEVNLKATLEKEIDGIFNWTLEGLQLYLEEGLRELPKEVKDATLLYQAEQDQLGRFLEDTKHPDTKSDSFTYARTLYAAYKQWATRAGEYYEREPVFAQRMSKKKPVEWKDWKKTNNGKIYLGFKLRPEFEVQEEY
jgi:putative DNA primase/helicase